MITIDANVFVSSRVRTEFGYQDSNQFLNQIVQSALAVVCPTLVVPETASAIARPTGDSALAQAAVFQIENFPYLSLIELTPHRARQAADIAVLYRLRGADSIYVAVAQEFGTTLITWDTEVITRGASGATVMSPNNWLTANAQV